MVGTVGTWTREELRLANWLTAAAKKLAEDVHNKCPCRNGDEPTTPIKKVRMNLAKHFNACVAIDLANAFQIFIFERCTGKRGNGKCSGCAELAWNF